MSRQAAWSDQSCVCVYIYKIESAWRKVDSRFYYSCRLAAMECANHVFVYVIYRDNRWMHFNYQELMKEMEKT